jgi:hypothetical protein
MSNNSLFRIAGIAGILGALLMLAMTFAIGAAVSVASPLYMTLSLLSVLAGIILVAGLYALYRGEAGSLSLVAAVLSVIGYLLFGVAALMKIEFPSPVLTVGDVLVYIVGVTLFSWLAQRTGKMPRLVPIVGYLAALSGLVIYLLVYGTGASMDNPTTSLSVFYFLYLFLVIVWLIWTGYGLLRRAKAQ